MPAARRSRRCLRAAPATGARGDARSPPRAGGIEAPSPEAGPCPKGLRWRSVEEAVMLRCSCHCSGLGFTALGRAMGLLHADSSGQSPREHTASRHWQRARARRRRRRIWRAERWHLGAGGCSCSAPPARHRALKRSQAQGREGLGCAPRVRGRILWCNCTRSWAGG